jgi:competence protein ComEC
MANPHSTAHIVGHPLHPMLVPLPIGLLVAGRRRALPALAAAVGVLVLVDPWLARSVGFALSVSATAGILLLANRWARAMSRIPRRLALVVTVPLAAQVACTPVLMATFGQFSVASVPANILVAPVVVTAMVLGLGTTLLGVIFPPGAAILAWCAGVPSWWIASVARWFAGQPGAEFDWGEGPAATFGGITVAIVAVLLLPALLRRPLVSIVAAIALTVVLFRAVPSPGWPPNGWLVVACDVGQGDGFVLRAGPRSAVVVDAGPEARPMSRCLDSLGIVHVPLLILTHYHADHVDGVPGVLDDRIVDEVVVYPLADPHESSGEGEC